MSKSFRDSASFGKRMEYKLIGDMLMEGLDCYVPLVDDHGVDCVIKKDDGTFIESYSTIKEAAAANNINTPTNICHAISGKQKRCGGFRWRYFYGNKDNIKPL